ncbi:O-antigen translocase [Candidatus Thiomargarita nelsonii]|uniref:O-antigen translocase n=1 Tax=Candidatus Thiomargarita nelsonii TaxID=1003181 RepID=A0A176S4F4_9GAMM|nr:O-antigen translocase [Candidatus Thiomargarita nelsonii]
MAIVSSVTPAISGKYEVAQVLPVRKQDALHLFVIAIYVTVLLSFLFLIMFLSLHDQVINIFDIQKLSAWILFVPFSLLMLGFLNTFSYYTNRKKEYNVLAKSKVIQSISAIFIQLFFGIFNAGFIGLLIASMISSAIATIYLLKMYIHDFTTKIFLLSSRKKALLKEYADFPAYNASTGLLNGLSVSAPVFFLSFYYPESMVGYFALVQRVAMAPLSFISVAVSQVNLKSVVDLVNHGQCVECYLYKISGVLLLITFFPFIILTLYAPELFSFVFGEKWLVAGQFTQIMIPAIALRFIVSTLSSTLGATKNNKIGAIWKIVYFVSTILVLSIYAPEGNIDVTLKAYVINEIVLAILYYVAILYAAKNPNNVITVKIV